MNSLDERHTDQILKRVEFDTNGGCWLWEAPHKIHGYGSYWDGQKSWRAHRAAYAAFVGPIPDGLVVRHKCDTPACVNPDHLDLGTQADNVADSFSRGNRSPRGPRKPYVRKTPRRVVNGPGTGRAHAKLTEEQVLLIRAGSESSRTLAAKYAVTSSLIRQIRRGEAWTSVPSAKNQKDKS